MAAPAQVLHGLDHGGCSAHKGGMISKPSFLDAMGKRCAKVEMVRTMPAADQAKMMKGTPPTIEGFHTMMKELHAR